MSILVACVVLTTLGSLVTAADMNLVLLKGAVAGGAQCLDGSAPAYYFRKGQGVNATKFLVHFEGVRQDPLSVVFSLLTVLCLQGGWSVTLTCRI